MVALPNLTEEGYRILAYRLKDFNPSNIIFGDGVKVTDYLLIINTSAITTNKCLSIGL